MIRIYPEPHGSTRRRPFIKNLFRRSRAAPGSTGLELGNGFQFPSPKPKENSDRAVRRPALISWTGGAGALRATRLARIDVAALASALSPRHVGEGLLKRYIVSVNAVT